MSVSRIVKERQDFRNSSEADFVKRQAERARKYPELYKTAKPKVNIGDSLGTVAGIAGAASYFNPVLAPVAAVGGIGYGTYKLGQSFNWW